MQSKRKSYTASFKMKVVAHSEEVDTDTGCKKGNRSAAKTFGVNESQVRKWKAKIDALREADSKRKRTLRPVQPKWPDLEKSLKEWVIEQRKEKRKVSTVQIRLEAKRMAAAMDIMNFRAGSGWCNKFMKRAGLSVRATTSIGQHLPENTTDLMDRFRTFLKAETATIHLKDIGNMDEVPVTFDMPGKYTVDKKGAQDITITTTGGEKTNFTVVLGVTADGNFCPPMVIFKRKTIPKEMPPGVVVKANCRGWMNETLMVEWIETCWMARKDPAASPEQAVLILDSARCHLTSEAKEAMRRRTKIAVIPGGLTKYLQPLDISVNKSFKSKLRKRWEEWMIDESRHTFTKNGRMRHATYAEVCSWVLASVREISVECVQNGFRRAFGESEYDDEVGESDYDDEVGESELDHEVTESELEDEEGVSEPEDEGRECVLDGRVGAMHLSDAESM